MGTTSEKELETARRAERRQAAPFAKDRRQGTGRRPGRRAGAEYGRRYRKVHSITRIGVAGNTVKAVGAPVWNPWRVAVPRLRFEVRPLARPGERFERFGRSAVVNLAGEAARQQPGRAARGAPSSTSPRRAVRRRALGGAVRGSAAAIDVVRKSIAFRSPTSPAKRLASGRGPRPAAPLARPSMWFEVWPRRRREPRRRSGPGRRTLRGGRESQPGRFWRAASRGSARPCPRGAGSGALDNRPRPGDGGRFERRARAAPQPRPGLGRRCRPSAGGRFERPDRGSRHRRQPRRGARFDGRAPGGAPATGVSWGAWAAWRFAPLWRAPSLRCSVPGC